MGGRGKVRGGGGGGHLDEVVDPGDGAGAVDVLDVLPGGDLLRHLPRDVLELPLAPRQRPAPPHRAAAPRGIFGRGSPKRGITPPR